MANQYERLHYLALLFKTSHAKAKDKKEKLAYSQQDLNAFELNNIYLTKKKVNYK